MTPGENRELQREQLRELALQPGYHLVMRRITETIERMRDQLEQPLSPEQTARVRGSIEAFRVALKVPEILMEELSRKT